MNTSLSKRGASAQRLRSCALAVSLACALLACGGALAPSSALADEPPTVQSSQGQELISKREAKDIALRHAGLKPRQVSDVKIRLGRANGKRTYLVKFSFKHMCYDYGVRAKSGRIAFYSAKRA